ncbi:DUF937 domain-containing protein [Paludisphaera rhizosphaerae]|uniref:DUF937 domain-containing protein n=1 Tax=Paludisphaera rhizosphaerae TaxID=2711216 RepID=UPI0013ED2DFB|nr:DUF937 domain-containing protein [Paludisphaera rhizosphaerae]
MSIDLLNQVKRIFNSDVVHDIARTLEEAPDRVERAISIGGSSILAGLLHMLTGARDSSALLDSLRREPQELARLDNLSASPGLLHEMLKSGSLESLAKHGYSMLRSILGDKLDRVSNLVADDAGVKPSSASTILSLLAPAFAGMIRKASSGRDLSLDSLRSLLADHRETILRQAPSGLAAAMGLNSFADLDSPQRTPGATYAERASVERTTTPSSRPAVVRDSVSTRVVRPEPEPSMARWAVPAALAALALLAGFYLLPRAGERPVEVVPQPAPAAPSVVHEVKPEQPAASAAVIESGRAVVETMAKGVSLTLPNNVTIEVPENSYIEAMYKALRDGKPVVAQTFVASDLIFDGDGKLTTDGVHSIEDIAKIAAAYPQVKLKVSGRESLKDAPKLVTREAALHHAEVVRDSLVHAGVPADRIIIDTVAANLPAEHPAAVVKDDVPISISLIVE